MASFVLVHGAWHGAWCWQRLVPHLSGLGHRVHAVTLTGLGERAHLASPSINLQTHIADVMGVLVAEELHDAVLVVHSYAGMLGTAVADRAGERLRHLVYLDAVVPKPGEMWCSTHSQATREARIAGCQAGTGYTFAPPDAAVFGLAGEDAAWVNRRQVPHPGHTYTEALEFDPQRVARVARTFIDCTEPPLATIDTSRRRVRDPHFWNGLWTGGGGAQVLTMQTGHDPMVSEPGALAALLHTIAPWQTETS